MYPSRSISIVTHPTDACAYCSGTAEDLEIVLQAGLTTTAAGAAIRLVRRGELVSLVAMGATAPEIAAYFKLHGGIGGGRTWLEMAGNNLGR